MHWTDDGFAAELVLFILNWVSSTLWQYLVLYYLGAMTNDPCTASHYGGGFRSGLAAGEALFFGIDSLEIPFVREAGVIFALYALGTGIFAYLGVTQIEDTMYFKEEHVVVPLEVLDNKTIIDPTQTQVIEGNDPDFNNRTTELVEQERKEAN